MGNEIALKPIKELQGMNFFIPDYQRGYRWTEQQVVDLLDDLEAFRNKKKTEEEIYCIQPLVVKAREDKSLYVDLANACQQKKSLKEIQARLNKSPWEVVDGQQRLTTLFIILSVLGEELYTIEYETRKSDSQKYLLNICNQHDNEDNVDYYYFNQSYTAIDKWCESLSKDNKTALRDTILNKVNFIWYCITDENPIRVFTRLNIGKIPLTDSELVKAMILNRTNFETDCDERASMLTIATEWDNIERTLQNDEFWLFLHSKDYHKSTRIDYILDLIQEKDLLGIKHKGKVQTQKKQYNKNIDNKLGTNDDGHKTFRYFHLYLEKALKEENGPTTLPKLSKRYEEAWKKIKEIFQTFNEWYNDYQLYHYVGYLTTIKTTDCIPTLMNAWDGKTREDFVGFVKKEIRELLKEKPERLDLDNFIYEKKYINEKGKNTEMKKTECVPILLLHNVETIIRQNHRLVENSKYNLPNFSKFPFHLYKSDKSDKSEHWDVEHISPNAGDKPIETVKDQKEYLTAIKDYLFENKLICRVENFLKSDNPQDFDSILADILAQDSELNDDDKNKIWNFTLLDSSTNREYQNVIFPVKRAYVAAKAQGKSASIKNGRIIDDGMARIAFVPVCTQYVFTKFYTTDSIPSPVQWSKYDARKYLEDMKEKLKDYLRIEEVTRYE